MPTDIDPLRAEGCLLGLASGNALGQPFEDLWPAEAIYRKSGGRVRFIDPSEASKPWDDETAQAMVVANLLSKGPWTLHALGQKLLEWRRENGRGIKTLVDRVLDDIDGEVPVEEASEDAFSRLGRNWSATNQGLVRSIPVALAHADDPKLLVSRTATACQVTHWNPLCVWSATALNLAIATVLRDEPLHLSALAEQIRALGGPESVSDSVRGARAGLATFELDGKSKAFTLKAMQLGLWALQVEREPVEDLVERVILAGGDTGANASVVGACLGARWGREALPSAWVDRLRDPRAIAQAARDLAFL
ncbi:MAG TPA: ADP-ribosylglycohydrolase family protein [Fibrobacteria bacterium]|nr:ADP-ribosylglycohydrolase family protein [Fibrobacteria bacterium]HOX52033.1 ADP-ribosylglycohydrolase family protein [Fibrobacteria bacterium]